MVQEQEAKGVSPYTTLYLGSRQHEHEMGWMDNNFLNLVARVKILVVRVRPYPPFSDADFSGKLFVAGLFWWFLVEGRKDQGCCGWPSGVAMVGQMEPGSTGMGGFQGLQGTYRPDKPPLISHQNSAFAASNLLTSIHLAISKRRCALRRTRKTDLYFCANNACISPSELNK